MRREMRQRYWRFFGARPDRDVEDEIAFHLDMRARELEARGMEAAQARDEAKRRFGDRVRLEAEMRRLEREKAERAVRRESFRGLLGDLGLAARALVRQPVFTLSAVLTLGLSIGANTAIFSAVNAFLLKPLAVEKPHELVQIASRYVEQDLVGNVSDVVRTEAAKLPVFSDAISWSVDQAAVRGTTTPRRSFYFSTSDNFFSMLGVGAKYGRVFTPIDVARQSSVVVLFYRYWREAFLGDSSVVGRTIYLNDLPFTVVGVTAPEFVGTQSLVKGDFVIPLQAVSLFEPRMASHLLDPSYGDFRVLARMRAGVTPEEAIVAVRQLGTNLSRQFPAALAGQELVAERESRTRPEFSVARQMPWVSGVFLAMVGLALLVACANVANLLTARATARRSELAVRAALGATPARLTRLLMAESIVLGVAGLGVAWVMARVCLAWLGSIPLDVGVPLDFGLTLDWRVFLYAACLALVAGAIAGAFPSLMAARTPVGLVLREGGRGGTTGRASARLRSGLVVTQVAVSLVLLVCGGLFAISARQATQIDLGFRRDHLVMGGVHLGLHRLSPAQTRDFQDRLLGALNALPSLRQAALGSHLPLAGSFATMTVMLEHEPQGPGKGTTVSGIASATPGFVGSLGLRLREGRDFRPTDDSTAPRVAIVNRAFADKVFPGRSAVGQHYRVDGDSSAIEVVGLIDNAQYVFLGEQPRLMAYAPLHQRPTPFFFVVAQSKADDARSVAGEVSTEIERLRPGVLFFDVRTMQEHLERGIAYFFVRTGATLAGAIGMLGLLQTLVGLYGVLSYAVSLRLREFGIRLALGASRSAVIRGVLRQGSVLLGLGLALGLAMALAVTRVLASLLVGVSPGNPAAFGGAVCVVVLLALVALYVPASRASRVAPASSMRSD